MPASQQPWTIVISARLVGPRMATWSPGTSPRACSAAPTDPGLVVDLAPRHELRLPVGGDGGADEADPGAGVRRLLEPLDRRARRHRRPRLLRPHRAGSRAALRWHDRSRRLDARRDRSTRRRHAPNRRPDGRADRRRPRRTGTRPRSPARSSCAGRTAWDADGTFETPNPAGPLADPDGVAEPRPQAVRPRHVPVPVAAPACTSATRWASSAPTSTPATSGWPAATCCTRWASTRSACPPSSTPCRPAAPGRSPRPRTSPPTAASCAASG